MIIGRTSPDGIAWQQMGVLDAPGMDETMSARVYNETLVVMTDGGGMMPFTANASGLNGTDARALGTFSAGVAVNGYSGLNGSFIEVALRVLPIDAHPTHVALAWRLPQPRVEQCRGGMSFAVFPLKSDDAGTVPVLSFGLPRVVDKAQMPTDFLSFGPESTTESVAVLGREFNTISTNGGRTWAPTQPVGRRISSVIHHFPKQCLEQRCTKLTSVGGWSSSNSTHFVTEKSRTFTLNASGQLVEGHGPKQMTFSGLPRPTEGSLRMGGSTSVELPGGRGFLFTAMVKWGGVTDKGCATTCNQSSIVVYHSHSGVNWTFLSVLADALDYPASLEGPNEHDVTLAPDGATLIAVVRFDAGDSNPKGEWWRPSPHMMNYHRTISRDNGTTWARLAPIPGAGCARPRLLVLGNYLLLSGGRYRVNGNDSDVKLWISSDGLGEAWEEHSLSYQHNLGVDDGGSSLFAISVYFFVGFFSLSLVFWTKQPTCRSLTTRSTSQTRRASARGRPTRTRAS